MFKGNSSGLNKENGPPKEVNESEEAKKDEHKEYTKKIKSEPSKIFNLNNY